MVCSVSLALYALLLQRGTNTLFQLITAGGLAKISAAFVILTFFLLVAAVLVRTLVLAATAVIAAEGLVAIEGVATGIGEAGCGRDGGASRLARQPASDIVFLDLAPRIVIKDSAAILTVMKIISVAGLTRRQKALAFVLAGIDICGFPPAEILPLNPETTKPARSITLRRPNILDWG